MNSTDRYMSPTWLHNNTMRLAGWKDNDPSNPQAWSLPRKWVAMVTCCCISIALTIPTSVEGPTQEAFNAHFGVNTMAGSMSTGRNPEMTV